MDPDSHRQTKVTGSVVWPTGMWCADVLYGTRCDEQLYVV